MRSGPISRGELIVLGKCVDCRQTVTLPFYDLDRMFGRPVVCVQCSGKPFREEIVGTRCWPRLVEAK